MIQVLVWEGYTSPGLLQERYSISTSGNVIYTTYTYCRYKYRTLRLYGLGFATPIVYDHIKERFIL